jgi:hypothetical protein
LSRIIFINISVDKTNAAWLVLVHAWVALMLRIFWNKGIFFGWKGRRKNEPQRNNINDCLTAPGNVALAGDAGGVLPVGSLE